MLLNYLSLKSIEVECHKFNILFASTITLATLLGTVLGLINSFAFIKIGDSGKIMLIE